MGLFSRFGDGRATWERPYDKGDTEPTKHHHDPTETLCADLDAKLDQAARRLSDGHLELAHGVLQECIAHKALKFTGGDRGPNRLEHRLNTLINMARLSARMRGL